MFCACKRYVLIRRPTLCINNENRFLIQYKWTWESEYKITVKINNSTTIQQQQKINIIYVDYNMYKLNSILTKLTK